MAQKEAKPLKKRKITRRAGKICLAVLVILLCAAAIRYIWWNEQRKQRMKNDRSAQIVLTDTQWEKMMAGGDPEVVEAADRTQTDRVFQYRDDLINILVMGIDKETKMWERDPGNNSIGQADTVLLASLDLKAGTLRLIAIPRDTMVSLEMYNDKGEYVARELGQLTLQYAYADGQKRSCELMRDRVSEVLCGIPIYGYVALNLNMIPAINDAIGGVEVTMTEDYTKLDRAFRKGETVRLKGSQALRFIQMRDTSQAGSAYERLMRQKTYLRAFASQAKAVLKDDISIVLELLSESEGNFETDLTEEDIAYLALQALSCRFSEEDIWVLPGEIQRGETYEEYHLDEMAVQAGVIRMFYDEST
ncbi:MAG: LCP family protein [Lachnospiraceae bacterium]|nr:LCP family protein [Lachnospiraceae bacterium]